MIERAPGSHDDLLLNHSLLALETIAESCMNEMTAPDLSLERGEVVEKANSLISKTLEQSRHVMNMIQHFRSLDTIKRDNFYYQGKGSVYDSVYQVLRAMQYEFPMEKITLLKILPRDLAHPSIPKGYLEAILFQLLYNAREAVGDVAGIITIEAAEKSMLSPENRHPVRFMLRVSDTGPGIPKDYLSNIYDPFFTTQNPCRLNGMGLCLVKRLVDQSGGMMRVETSLMGTSYFVEFSR